MKKLVRYMLTAALTLGILLPSTSVQAASSHLSTWSYENGNYYFYMSNGQKMVNEVTPEGVLVDAEGKATNYWVVDPVMNPDGTIKQWGAFNTPAVYPNSYPYYASNQEATNAYRNNSSSKIQFENRLKSFNQDTWLLASSYNYLNDKASREAMKQDLLLMNNYNFIIDATQSTDAQVRLEAYVAEMQRMAYINYLTLAIKYEDEGDENTAAVYTTLLSNALNNSRAVLTNEQKLFEIAGSPYYGYPTESEVSSSSE